MFQPTDIRPRGSLLLAGLLVCVLAACSGDESAPVTEPVVQDPPTVDIERTADLLERSGCKDYDTCETVDDFEKWECLEWLRDSDGTLYLTHINITMNCAPAMTSSLSIQGNRIVIETVELFGWAMCDCAFDLHFEVPDVPVGVYEFVLLRNGSTRVEGTFDLDAAPSGVRCVPWQLTFEDW